MDIRFMMFQLLYNFLFIITNIFMILECKNKLRNYYKQFIWLGYLCLGIFGEIGSDAHTYRIILNTLKFNQEYDIEYFYKFLAKLSNYNYQIFMGIIITINIFFIEFLMKKFKIKRQFLCISVFTSLYLLDSINIIRAAQMQLLLLIVSYYYLNKNKILAIFCQIIIFFVQKTGLLGILFYFDRVIKKTYIFKYLLITIILSIIVYFNKNELYFLLKNTKYITYLENERSFGVMWWIFTLSNFGLKIFFSIYFLKKYLRNQIFYERFRILINFQIMIFLCLIVIAVINISPHVVTRIFLIAFNFNLILIPKYIEISKNKKQIYQKMILYFTLILMMTNLNLFKFMLWRLKMQI